jgi:hypothetical protein
MSYQYYGQNKIALPGRTVQTFPSGLVRVEQMYAVRKGQPAPFGLDEQFGKEGPFYVFPSPEVVEEEDGFIKYKVTAYGRTATAQNQGIAFYDPRVTRGYVKAYYIRRNVLIIRFFSVVDGEKTVVKSQTTERDLKFDSVNSTYTRTQVVGRGELVDFSLPTDNAEVRSFPELTTLLNPPQGSEIVFSWELSGVSSVNYGYWTEYTMNFQAAAVLSLTSIAEADISSL